MVIRDSGLMGAACDIFVEINGVKVASLPAGKAYVAHVEPGTHRLAVGYAPTVLCPEARMVRTVVVGKDPVRYRFSMSANFQIFLEEN